MWAIKDEVLDVCLHDAAAMEAGRRFNIIDLKSSRVERHLIVSKLSDNGYWFEQVVICQLICLSSPNSDSN